jgi:hypothetical protein
MKKRRKVTTSIPSRQDINVYDSLDERSACEHFLGKNLDEAEALIRENLLHYHEDLMWMGPRAFNYYARAAMNYLRSAAADGQDAAFFLTDVEFRLDPQPQDLAPVARELADYCQHVIDQWPRWKEDTEPFYGDLLPRYIKLLDTLQHL